MRQLSLNEWPRIKAGCLAVLKKCDEDWIPEDVYHSIAKGESFAFEIGTGVAVVQFSPYLTGRMMFVWVLAMPHGNDKRAVIDALDSLAKSARCGVIRFHSKRDGWADFVTGEYEPVATVYERKVHGIV